MAHLPALPKGIVTSDISLGFVGQCQRLRCGDDRRGRFAVNQPVEPVEDMGEVAPENWTGSEERVPPGNGRLAGGEACRIRGRSTVLSSRRKWRLRRSARTAR